MINEDAPRPGNRGADDQNQGNGADESHRIAPGAEGNTETFARTTEPTRQTGARKSPTGPHSAARAGFDVIYSTLGGETVGVIVPVIPDDAPTSVREGFARRRLVAVGQRCPCGARPFARDAVRRAGKNGPLSKYVIVHEDNCPATDDNLMRALRGWAA
jgi:hypothetical protein